MESFTYCALRLATLSILWLPLPRWIGDNAEICSDSNIPKMVRASIVFSNLFQRMFNKVFNDIQLEIVCTCDSLVTDVAELLASQKSSFSFFFHFVTCRVSDEG